MSLFAPLFGARPSAAPDSALAAFLQGASIEVTPKGLAGLPDFAALLPQGTRVYVAHIDGTPQADMTGAVARLAREGFAPMPHIPARMIENAATLDRWLGDYAQAGARQALAIAGGLATPRGQFSDSMEMLSTGLFDRHGYRRIHVAGHPEGSKDIDPDGSNSVAMKALKWKQAFADRSDAELGVATQFCFEPEPVLAWADALKAGGVSLPIHIGASGPAKPQNLLKYAMMCGVGPSLRVIQRRAADLTNLLVPFEPTEFLAAIAARKAADPGFNIVGAHIFPLGGIKTAADWLARQRKA